MLMLNDHHCKLVPFPLSRFDMATKTWSWSPAPQFSFPGYWIGEPQTVRFPGAMVLLHGYGAGWAENRNVMTFDSRRYADAD